VSSLQICEILPSFRRVDCVIHSPYTEPLNGRVSVLKLLSVRLLTAYYHNQSTSKLQEQYRQDFRSCDHQKIMYPLQKMLSSLNIVTVLVPFCWSPANVLVGLPTSSMGRIPSLELLLAYFGFHVQEKHLGSQLDRLLDTTRSSMRMSRTHRTMCCLEIGP
jgi:hypothetical protein